MEVTQLSVFLENKPGHLERILEILTDENINILTLTIAETSDFGVLRMLVNDTDRAVKALHDHHFTCSQTEVLVIGLEDRPGALYRALSSFTRRGLNIEYMYAFNEKRDDLAMMIFRFEDPVQARAALAAEGYRTLTRQEILKG
ncbi:MAG: ACT domain-containing protein [Sedimentisphaerales bacterium]|nr:ACT domain-containing protein [Sedimentisphaerales bacterium]